MLFRGKSLHEVGEADIQAFVDEVERGKAFDYKQELHLKTDRQKNEFLYDVTSFANSGGGHLIYGIAEEGGVATGVVGLDLPKPGDVVAQITNIITDGVAPRIPGVDVQPVPLSSGRYALVIEVPRSFSGPHMVTRNGVDRFYVRDSAGKRGMTVDQLRSAFLLTGSLRDRIRNFRAERLGQIVAQETPVPLPEAPTAVLHLVPISAFEEPGSMDVAALERQHNRVPFVHEGGLYTRLNFDGVLAYPGSAQPHWYTQVYRTGVIEAVHGGLFYPVREHMSLREQDSEYWLVGIFARALALLQEEGIEPPLLLMVSFLNVRNCLVRYNPERWGDLSVYPIDRDTLQIGDVWLEHYPARGIEQLDVLKPILDALWNAGGHPGWRNYAGWRAHYEGQQRG